MLFKYDGMRTFSRKELATRPAYIDTEPTAANAM